MATEAAYSPESKAEALAMYIEVGSSAASRLTGIHRATLWEWAKAAGLATVAPEKVRAAAEAARDSWEARKLVEALEAGTGAADVREEMLGLALSGKSKDANNLVRVYEALIDKAQLLSGGATTRTDTLDVEERRERIAQWRDELAERRVS